MMDRISLSYFIGPASVFDLRGYIRDGSGEPCRVRVGPHRFLNITVDPGRFKLDLWAMVDRQVTYLPGQDIPEIRDKNGIFFFDAEKFLRERFGFSSPCSKESYRWKKNRRGSDTFLTTQYGAAASRENWLDISVIHSSLFFAPGALTICGRSVCSIHWSTFEEDSSVHGKVLRPLAESALSEPHQLGVSDFKSLLPGLYKAGGLYFNDLQIETDCGKYSMAYSYKGSSLSAFLQDGGTAACRSVRTELPDVLELLLHLMQASTKEKLDGQLAKMGILGLADIHSDHKTTVQ